MLKSVKHIVIMTALFSSRISLLRIAFDSAVNCDNPDLKKELSECLFWIADTMERDAQTQDYPLQKKFLADLGELKDMLENGFKNPSALVGIRDFHSLCSKLSMSLPDQSRGG